MVEKSIREVLVFVEFATPAAKPAAWAAGPLPTVMRVSCVQDILISNWHET
jgi:hypothetical protein